jgi:hypothetical protein
LAEPAVQQVVTPALVAVLIFALFCLSLFIHDGHSPLFHVGLFAAGTALVYITLPPLFFVLSGLEWTDTSDGRLQLLHTNEVGVSGYAWRGALYLSGFCLTYVLVIWNLRRPEAIVLLPTTRKDIAICGCIIVACFAYQTGVEFAYGVSLSQSNADLAADPATRHLPLAVGQLTHNILAIQRIAELALIIALVGLWKKKWARLTLVILLLSELFFTLNLSGSRTHFAVLLLGTLLSFHKLVRPIGMPVLAACGILFLSLLLGYGYFRSHSDSIDFSTANEFQVLMATALHVRVLIESGLTAPPQVSWSEVLMLVPQQLLPIEKIDPSNWYLLVSGFGDSGSGFMFGVQSQAEIGWGNFELFVRGVVLALVLGVLHRKYSKRPLSFLLLVSYIWLLTTIYYSYRAGTFYWVTFVVFRLLIFIGAFLILRRLFRRLFSRFNLSEKGLSFG